MIVRVLVEDLEAWDRALKSQGQSWVIDPVYGDDGSGVAVLAMPAGYRIELHQPPGIYLA